LNGNGKLNDLSIQESVIKNQANNLYNNEKWKDLDLYNLIHSPLMMANNNFNNAFENIFILQGELMKFSLSEGNKHTYSEKYCVLTSIEFKYYKSKECFLRNQGCLLSIPLSHALMCEVIPKEGIMKNKKNYEYLLIKTKEKFNYHSEEHKLSLETGESTIRSIFFKRKF